MADSSGAACWKASAAASGIPALEASLTLLATRLISSGESTRSKSRTRESSPAEAACLFRRESSSAPSFAASARAQRSLSARGAASAATPERRARMVSVAAMNRA